MPRALSSFFLVVPNRLFLSSHLNWWVETLASSIIHDHFFLDLSLPRHYTLLFLSEFLLLSPPYLFFASCYYRFNNCSTVHFALYFNNKKKPPLFINRLLDGPYSFISVMYRVVTVVFFLPVFINCMQNHWKHVQVNLNCTLV